MKRIGIDARLYSQTGVGNYIANLLSCLQQILPKNILVYVYMMGKYTGEVKFKNSNFIIRKADFKWHTFSEQLSFAKMLYQDELDLMHFTYFSYPALYRRQFISTIHDVTPLYFKTGKASTKSALIYEVKHFFFRIIIENQVRNARAIITPTQTVKQQIGERFGEKYLAKIYPIYEGVNEKLIEAKENKSLVAGFPKEFFIYVGTFYPHKNVEKLIEAYSRVKTETRLILIGPDDFFEKRLRLLVKKLKLEKKIIFYLNPSLVDLVFFYKNAQALIHPSLSEGFGLPLVEAAYFDLPIIASNINVFKEVLENNYLQFDPNDIDDIQDKIEQFIGNEAEFNYAKIIKKYSFEEMTRFTLAIYENILG